VSEATGEAPTIEPRELAPGEKLEDATPPGMASEPIDAPASPDGPRGDGVTAPADGTVTELHAESAAQPDEPLEEIIPADALDEKPSDPPPETPAQPAAPGGAAPEAKMDEKLTGSVGATETKEAAPTPEHREFAVDHGPVTLEVTHGSYHGPGCPDADKRKWPKDRGFDYDGYHPAYVGELVEGLSREEADRLIKTGAFKEVKPGSK